MLDAAIFAEELEVDRRDERREEREPDQGDDGPVDVLPHDLVARRLAADQRRREVAEAHGRERHHAHVRRVAEGHDARLLRAERDDDDVEHRPHEAGPREAVVLALVLGPPQHLPEEALGLLDGLVDRGARQVEDVAEVGDAEDADDGRRDLAPGRLRRERAVADGRHEGRDEEDGAGPGPVDVAGPEVARRRDGAPEVVDDREHGRVGRREVVELPEVALDGDYLFLQGLAVLLLLVLLAEVEDRAEEHDGPEEEREVLRDVVGRERGLILAELAQALRFPPRERPRVLEQQLALRRSGAGGGEPDDVARAARGLRLEHVAFAHHVRRFDRGRIPETRDADW